jgi:hypothetical protein
MHNFKRQLKNLRKALVPIGIQSMLAIGTVAAQTVTVVEFHNTKLNHYFVTADPGEASAIDAGTAGAGWVRTGQAFSAYAAQAQENSSGVSFSPVCRFYALGPNSHFYTSSAGECSTLRSLESKERAESSNIRIQKRIVGACSNRYRMMTPSQPSERR